MLRSSIDGKLRVTGIVFVICVHSLVSAKRQAKRRHPTADNFAVVKCASVCTGTVGSLYLSETRGAL